MTVTLGYNPAGQIFSRAVSNSSYIYAPTGTDGYTINGLNRVTGIAHNGGSPASVTYDSNGNVTAGLGASLGYDDQDNLASAAGTTTWLHDPLGRMYNQVISGTTTRFAYDGMKLSTEYSGASGTTIAARHVPGLWMDDIALSYSGTGTSTPSWPLTDERGSVIALTDGSGAVTAINTYNEYGAPASGNTGRFQYTGQVWLPTAGLYDYKMRSYAAGTGRFVQTDPLGYATGANLYSYVAGDPLNLFDPSGMQSVPQQGEEESNPGEIIGYGRRCSWFDACITYQEYLQQLLLESTPVDEIIVIAQPIVSTAATAAVPDGLSVRVNYRRYTIFGGIQIGIITSVELCNCFTASTLVQTESGLKRIQDIKVGDLVASRDDLTGSTEFQPVVALVAGHDRPIWDVTIETVDSEGSRATEVIGTTEEHPWRRITGVWAKTSELEIGFNLVTLDGRMATVLDVTPTARVEPTFNIEVDNFHTYFVGQSSLWVHNSCNKLGHIFNNPRHQLGPLLSRFGGDRRAAYNAVQAAANRELAAGRLVVGPNGVLPSAGNVLNVGGVPIQLSGGRVMNGSVEIGSFSGVVRLPDGR